MKPAPVLSPVDYDAWGRGYTPPGEHVLIDALQFDGAKIAASSQWPGAGWWLVTTGDGFTPKQAIAIRAMIDMTLEASEKEATPTDCLADEIEQALSLQETP